MEPRDLEPDERLTYPQLNGLEQYFSHQYWNNSHESGEIFRSGEAMLRLPEKSMRELGFVWLKFCELFIFHIYSSLVLHKGVFSIGYQRVIEDTSLGKVFDKGFINMLKSLLNTRWIYGDDEENKITINGKDINSLENGFQDPQISSKKIAIKKVWLNAFITLFIKNSLDGLDTDGYNSELFAKNVEIEIQEHMIRITDIPIGDDYKEEEKIDREVRFEAIKKSILEKNLDFMHKTIPSFLGLIEFMRNWGYDEYTFTFGFNDDRNFSIELRFGIIQSQKTQVNRIDLPDFF